MLLHKLYLNPRCREARRDLANPYELHSTLCRAFSTPDKKCPAGAFLWRLELMKDNHGYPVVLVQSTIPPDWSRIGIEDWFKTPPVTPLDLVSRLVLEDLQVGQRFRFRLRANPCISRDGKRQGLLNGADQVQWIARKGMLHGFTLPKFSSFTMDDAGEFDVMISQEEMLKGQQRAGHEIRVFSVLFDGFLTVTDVEKFRSALLLGIGHGKSMGLGLLSVAPVR